MPRDVITSELPTFEASLPQIPATVCTVLGVQAPGFLPTPIQEITSQFRGVDRVVFVLLDNFGLFEVTYYKPQFLIESCNALVLLGTKNPYTLGVLHQIMYGGFDIEPNGFHLLRFLNQNGKTTAMVGRDKDLKRYDGGTNAIPKDSDMNTWIEAAKLTNRTNFSWFHFLDFENLYRQQAKLGRDPGDLIDKLLKRTDKWILSMHKQLRGNSLMIVLGDHGRFKMDLNYTDKIAQWRQASVPIAIVIKKN